MRYYKHVKTGKWITTPIPVLVQKLYSPEEFKPYSEEKYLQYKKQQEALQKKLDSLEIILSKMRKNEETS